MGELTKFKDLPINWDIGPADAVALHLEWGNTGYSGRHQNSDDESYYFSVDSWKEPYIVRLQKMTKDGSETLHEMELPNEYWDCCRAKGAHELPEEIKDWLRKQF
jgi:hypothetical protein